jgi:bacteriorhodopsin
MKKIMSSLLNRTPILALVALLVPSNAYASSGVVLKSNDFVGVSFWMISMALVAATAFFFLETQRVTAKWKTSLTVSGLVTLVAAWHYFYMRDVWVATGETPTVYRYIDWLVTVPLLMIEFYLILAAITKVPAGVFWRLLIGTFVMLAGGYVGEAGYFELGLGNTDGVSDG